MEYSFDVEVATRYGVTAAVLLKNIGFWIAKNIHNKKHFHENKYWTYNSYKSFGKLYPFWTPKQIRTVLDKLVDDEVLLKGNFSAKGFDRTNWYTIVDEWVIDIYVTPICPGGQADLTNRAVTADPEGQPISDINTDNKPDLGSKHELRRFFFDLYKGKIAKITKEPGNNPPWGGKEGSLFKGDFERIGEAKLQQAMILFFSDEVKSVSQFTSKAGYTYNVFHGVLEKLILSKKSVRICPECLEIGKHSAECPTSIAERKKRTAQASLASELREENANIDLTSMFKEKLKEKQNG